MQPLQPIGFWSYTSDDDLNNNGRLTQLRELLARELAAQMGHRSDVRVFQDVLTIPPGSEWENALHDALGQSSFFIAILTPRFLHSKMCCVELRRFRQREIELGRSDLIFPIHYTNTDDLDPDRIDDCPDPEMFRLLRARQIIDFRDVRLRDPENEHVRSRIERLAASIRTAMRRGRPAPAGRVPPVEAGRRLPRRFWALTGALAAAAAASMGVYVVLNPGPSTSLSGRETPLVKSPPDADTVKTVPAPPRSMRADTPAADAARRRAASEDMARQYAAIQDTSRDPPRQAAMAAPARPDAESQEAARQDAVKQEAARQDAARREAARQDAARQEAARQDAAKQEAARQDAARQEAARQDAAKQEAARQDAAKQEAARQNAANQEAIRLDNEKRETVKALTTLRYYTAPAREPSLSRVGDPRDAIIRWQLAQGQDGTGSLSPDQREQLLGDARGLAGLLTVPDTSPRGMAANAVKGAEARFNRGSMLDRGDGVPRDVTDAAYWYALAAADGWAAAYTNLGLLYVGGQGVPGPDFGAAERLWLAAAALGERTAMFDLGALAETRRDGHANTLTAKRWYARGAERKDAPSAAALKRLGG